MVTAACLTLAAVHTLVWWRRRSSRANLLFAVTSVATTLLGAGEIWMMRARDAAEFATALRWTHASSFVLIVALVGFVSLYLRAGWRWLAWLICALRTLALVLNFSTGVNLYYRQVTSLRHIAFLGETISVGVGGPNPWMLVAQFSLLLLIVFVADVTVTVWRRGERRRALIVGGGILLSTLLAGTQSVLVFWNVLTEPILTSVFYMGIVAAMGFELSRDVIRAADLVDELRASEEQRASVAQAVAQLRLEIVHVGRVTVLSQFASAIAHEINQPLGAILRNAEAAQLFLQKDPPDHAEIRAILEDVCSDIQRAGAVIDRMRTLLQRRPPETRALGLAEVLGEVAELARGDLVAREVRLEMQVPDDLPPVLADRVHIQQVLLNLILNGADAVDGLGPERRRIAVSARAVDAEAVEIAVSDGGGGIPDEQLARVFEPYFTTKANGLGMGLPISRTIIEAHGGRLWAENIAGGGARFCFTLPTGHDAAAP